MVDAARQRNRGLPEEPQIMLGMSGMFSSTATDFASGPAPIAGLRQALVTGALDSL